MTTTEILKWIKTNLSADIQTALSKYPLTVFTEADLGGITCRETGRLISRYAMLKPSVPLPNIYALMRGDYSARKGETEKTYHGYGLTQIDIGSYPDFVKSGDWKIPLKCYLKSLEVLEGKKKYLVSKFPDMEDAAMKHATISAYNEGEGNARKAMNNGLDSDAYTTGHDYAKAVEGYALIYSNLD